MKKNIKKLIAVFILSMTINACEKLYRCDIPPKNISTLTESLKTLNSAPEKLEIDGKLIESTYNFR